IAAELREVRLQVADDLAVLLVIENCTFLDRDIAHPHGDPFGLNLGKLRGETVAGPFHAPPVHDHPENKEEAIRVLPDAGLAMNADVAVRRLVCRDTLR